MAEKRVNAAGRVFFSKEDAILSTPDLISHQRESWRNMIDTGLSEIFNELNPIEDYTGQRLSLKFKKYEFHNPKTTKSYAKENNITFEAPLHVQVELTNKVTGEVKEQEIYLGDYPWMTNQGTFIINGTERVIVSQLVRSEGVYFNAENYAGKKYYGAKIIPARGAWLEFETDPKTNVIYVKIDRRRKITATTLIRALAQISKDEVKEIFKDVDSGDIKYIETTLEKDSASGPNEALIEVYRRLRPGDLATIDNARSMIERMFFDFKRFDYGRVGRYKINKRLNIETPNTVDNRTFQMDDLYRIIKEVIRLNNEQGEVDDIDSLENRRVKLVGELVARQFRVGMLRMQRNAMDRMSLTDIENVTPGQLINARPVVAAVREFFAGSQLAQVMDETNPLSELSHKRRLSSMGPGGVTRDRAGLEVRDSHPTHYGRICLVETPEGANVGLVTNLATFARINEYGFIEAPYLRVKDGKVTDEVVYLDAAQEAEEIIADAGSKLNDDGTFVEQVSARKSLVPSQVERSEVTLMDAVHRQVLGAAASLIPFLERDRIDRALTGSSMQKQAVPLLWTEAPTVGTGVEADIARNLSQLITAEDDGEVLKADANTIEVKYKNGITIYELKHFEKTADDRCYNQKVIVTRGQKVKKGDILAEGASISNGELALGRDLRVAFMSWGGYNMDDAVIISDRLVKNDALTNINIKDYMVEVRETKLGPEQVTRDIPNVSEYALRHLDENGIVQVGSEVKAGDVLVGKITPKGEQELSSEERLLRAIFGEKAKDVRDTSQRMGNSGAGKVIGVKIFSRENGHEMRAGVLMQIQIFIAEARKIMVGDKMAGRHGNKGVVAKILPESDMPFMEDGTPIDVILSPLGVPSRMNLGQLFEVHLGMAAKTQGYRVATPTYDGVDAETLSDELEAAGVARDGKVQLYDGLTGEPFEQRTTVGFMHMIKLHHLVADKIHARSTGPYTMVTQQPLGGKAQNGGQRFGEMEVWALEAYGAANMLQEMLTIKSDDVVGRAKAYESIIKNNKIVGPELPESFNVLVKELQGLGLRVDLLDEHTQVDAEELLSVRNADVDSSSIEDEEYEAVRDESDGEFENNMNIQDIDEIDEIKEEA